MSSSDAQSGRSLSSEPPVEVSGDCPDLLACGCLPDEDHTKPHWCHHDGGYALVPPPRWLFYVGKKWSDDKLETRDCSHVAAPRVVDVVEAL